jgi:hypothetical protein
MELHSGIHHAEMISRRDEKLQLSENAGYILCAFVICSLLVTAYALAKVARSEKEAQKHL